MKKHFFIVSLVLLALIPNMLYASDLQLKLSDYKEEYNIKENINITVQIQNNGKDTIILPALFIPEDYYIRFIIENSNGNKAIFIGKEYKLRLSQSDIYRIKPEMFIGGVVHLKEYYELKPGKYTMYAIFEINEKRRNEKGVWVGKLISKQINFKINE